MRKVISRGAARACYLLALLLSIVLVRMVFADAFGYVGDSWWGAGTAEDGGTSAAFQIRGDATAPVSPGVSVPLALRFNNPHQQRMVVTHVHVTIRQLSAPGADEHHPCSRNDYVLHQMKSSVRIILPPSGTAGLESLGILSSEWPRIGMVNRKGNQDGCRGAQLVLGYTAFGSLNA
jgi:hypothetical protein